METNPHLPELISLSRDNHPDSIALSYGDEHLSYEALHHRAGQFAGYLTQQGLQPGATVAICMERSFDWIVAALGIMRAGAAYVPLDSAWPDSRLQFAITDSGASFLVARKATLDRLQCKAQGIDPCRDAAQIAAATELPSARLAPGSLAYVIYTSGSTGVPKGVEITHANLAHLIRWHRDRFGVTPRDRASHLAGLGYDAAVWEIWPNLAAGATVCLAEDTVRSSPQLLQRWLIRERITIAFVPTIHAAPMLAMDWPAATSLRFLLTGGDALRRAPEARLPFSAINNYGPTECTVVALSGALKTGSSEIPTLGCPIKGACIYLLNELREPVPDGSIGEIYIGGNGVGHGYRNLPDATDRNFLPDSFCSTPGARMYRTGDRGMRLPNGEIEFHGRQDRQVKIRGQRVELDEIDSVLARHPSIDFATAVTQPSDGGEYKLVAYILPKEKSSSIPTAEALQQHLLRSLPDYMVPNVFVRLHALPLSANGKVDRTILPRPTDANVLEKAAAKAPATKVEQQLLVEVRKLLENPGVRTEDNFFLAGGHSLLGMQLLTRIRSVFGVDLTVQQLFEAPSADRLARLIETKLAAQRVAAIWTDLLSLEHVEPDADFFDIGGSRELFAPLQQRLKAEFGHDIAIEELSELRTVRLQAQRVRGHIEADGGRALPPGVLALRHHGTRRSIFWVHYLSAHLAKAMGDDQPFLSVTLSAEDVASLGQTPALQEIAACFVRKIVAIQPEGPYTIGGFCLGSIFAYEVASQLQAAGKKIALLVLVGPPNPSDFKLLYPLGPKLTEPRFLLKRIAWLGPRKTAVKLRERLSQAFSQLSKPRSFRAAGRPAQAMMKTAVLSYQPRKYEGDGKVLLLLASDRPPHMGLSAGWPEIIPGNLHVEYVTRYHDELMIEAKVRHVAGAIEAHLVSGPWPASPAPEAETQQAAVPSPELTKIAPLRHSIPH